MKEYDGYLNRMGIRIGAIVSRGPGGDFIHCGKLRFSRRKKIKLGLGFFKE